MVSDDPGARTQVDPVLLDSSPARPRAGMDVTERVRLERPLGRGGMAEVWVADHLTLGVKVAVKFLRSAWDLRLRERFAREAQVAARIDHPHAVRVFDHGVTSDGRPFMVMERIDGEPLSERVRRSGPLAPAETETVVAQIADVLTHAHGQDIVHRDIKPHNVMLVRGERLYAKVLDFGLAKQLFDETDPELTEAGWVLGTPAYMAPEQLVEALPATASSDVWSLAVIAYELLTGARPFRGRVQAAIALAMLTQRYIPPSEARPELPPAIDGFFERAFAARLEDRFASAAELADAFSSALSGASQSLAVAGRIHLPPKLYGREPELARVRDALEGTRNRSRLLLIDGFSGVGKTALVEEARRRLADRGVIFIDGKFDQLRRGTPYDSLIQALRKLVRFIASREDDSVEEWRTRLDDELGAVATILTDFIPELQDLLGVREAPSETSPPEMRNRLQHAIGRLLHSVASPERPLFLFLDDLQWADLPTLELLGKLVGGPEDRGVLLVGSYRSNEIDANHPLHRTLSELAASDSPPERIALGPLGEDAVLELLNEVLGPGSGRVRLAVLCHEKTRGNPFFLRRFLESLHEDGVLALDQTTLEWQWSASAIRSRPMAEDVVAFIAAEIRRLPPLTSQALALASCIGGQFELGALAQILDIGRRRALERLRPALTGHLIEPGSEDLWVSDEVGAHRVTFRFAHDRIQQAARSLVSSAEAAATHKRIADFLLEHLDGTEREARLFELVEHLNRSADLQPALAPNTEQRQRLNLSAARRAQRSAAFAPADGYYRRALELFEPSQWEEDHADAFALHVEAARSAYVAGDTEEMDRLIAIAVERARSPLEVVRAREVRIHGLLQEQRFAEAVDLAIELLARLGAPLPEEPTDADVQAALGATLTLLGEHDRQSIVSCPVCQDEAVQIAQRIRQAIMSAAYLTSPQRFVLLSCEQVRSTLDDGLVAQSAYGFAVFGMVLHAVGMLDQAYETGKTARAILEKIGDRSTMAKTQHVVTAHIDALIEPVASVIDAEQQIHQLGMDAGDLEYAGWALHVMVAYAFYAGMRLPTLREMDRRNVALLQQYRQGPALGCALPFSQAIRNCIGEDVSDTSRLVGPSYDEERHMEEVLSVGFRGAAYLLTVMRSFVRYLFRDVEGALATAELGGEYADGAAASWHPVWWHQVHALALLGAKGADGVEAARVDLERLEHFRRFSEVNHRHRVELVAAEVARVEERDGDALAHYDAAIAHAREHGFLHEEALANELAARFYLERGSERAARGFLVEARDAYDEWGAEAKVEQLEAELGHVLRRRRR